MSKFRVRMKLQGFELEIDGTREDIPAIGQSIGDQLSGLIAPAVSIIEGEVDKPGTSGSAAILNQHTGAETARKKTRKKRTTSATSSSTSNAVDALDWRHDAAKYGMPGQAWNTAKKAIWLLYVAGECVQQNTLSSKQISETFNKHFKQAGTILPFNITRDLGKAKLKKPSPVGEDSTKDPSGWFLTDEGNRQAQELIAERAD